MSDDRRGWLTSRWGRLPFGPKMLLILSLGLLPLGIIAIVASVYSARENAAQRADQTLERLDDKAERIDELLARAMGTMRAASAGVAAAPGDPQSCENILRRLTSLQPAPGRFGLYGPDNRLLCATSGFVPILGQRDPSGQTIEISPDEQTLRLTLFGEDGAIEGVAEFSRAALSDLTTIPGTPADFNLELLGGGRRMVLRQEYRRVPFVQTVTDTTPIADGRLQLRIRLGATPVRLIDVLLILLPVMMWIAAAAIGWWILSRQLLRPLAQIQKAVSSYRPGDRPPEQLRLQSPAREIGDLGTAFDEVTRTVARHEADLEAAVERQTRLVREVHHRVKNNLQVVASLLNLHSRGSPSPEVAAAYASIQRRVDALAVVHRNHYAELEENRGVALKALISELAANLRATAPASAAGMQIRLGIEALHVTQDVAVSVAFLVTEIAEYAMLCGAGELAIALEAVDEGHGRLTLEMDRMSDDAVRDEALTDRFHRIITGLARQLRSTLDGAPEEGSYSVLIAVTDGRSAAT